MHSYCQFWEQRERKIAVGILADKNAFGRGEGGTKDLKSCAPAEVTAQAQAAEAQAQAQAQAQALVERFDIEPSSDFSAK